MSHRYAKKGSRLYRYCICTTKQKQGRDACATPSPPAQEIEDFVVEQIRKLARDPDLARQVFEEASRAAGWDSSPEGRADPAPAGKAASDSGRHGGWWRPLPRPTSHRHL
jgi:hypothetical protein